MKHRVEFTRSPIVIPAAPTDSREVGALVEFQGLVREMEDGKPIASLFYEAHEPMARSVLARILDELGATHGCEEVLFIHRLDWVPVGEEEGATCRPRAPQWEGICRPRELGQACAPTEPKNIS